jgi:hypothetical protein
VAISDETNESNERRDDEKNGHCADHCISHSQVSGTLPITVVAATRVGCDGETADPSPVVLAIEVPTGVGTRLDRAGPGAPMNRRWIWRGTAARNVRIEVVAGSDGSGNAATTSKKMSLPNISSSVYWILIHGRL